jgi:hypothetical protein
MVMLQSAPSRHGGASSPGPLREVLLEESAAQAARDWTSRWFRTLADDGRPVEGGWPGTVQEARACVAAGATRVLEQRAMPALTSDELSRLTRMTYELARRLWRTSAGQPG